MKKYSFVLLFLQIIVVIFSTEALSNGYKEFKLNMSKEDVEALLAKSRDFNIKKEEILVTRMEPDTEIISAEGFGFIIYGYFHFDHDQLFQIFIKLDDKKLGYYYLLKKFTERYGTPTTFSPVKASWENDKIRLVLEKPCSLKYLYLPIWNSQVSKDEKKKTVLESLRDNFIDGL